MSPAVSTGHSPILTTTGRIDDLPDWGPPGHAIYAVYPGSRLLPPRLRAFVDYLAKLSKPRPYWETGKPPPEIGTLSEPE